MTSINNLPLCITLGDPLGIGPEITARTLDFLQKKKINISFIVIGSKKAFHKACENLNINEKLKYIKEFIDYDENIEFFSKPSIVGGSISYKSICFILNISDIISINGKPNQEPTISICKG